MVLAPAHAVATTAQMKYGDGILQFYTSEEVLNPTNE